MEMCIVYIIITLGRGAKYCLYVGLSARISKKPRVQPNLMKTFFLLPWVGQFLSSDDSVLCSSGFVDDVMFSHNGASGAE